MVGSRNLLISSTLNLKYSWGQALHRFLLLSLCLEGGQSQTYLSQEVSTRSYSYKIHHSVNEILGVWAVEALRVTRPGAICPHLQETPPSETHKKKKKSHYALFLFFRFLLHA